MFYQCYYHGSAGGIIERVDFHAPNDASAVSIAQEKYNETPDAGHGFEVWEDSRRVYAQT